MSIDAHGDNVLSQATPEIAHGTVPSSAIRRKRANLSARSRHAPPIR